jgi:hypothetical protein
MHRVRTDLWLEDKLFVCGRSRIAVSPRFDTVALLNDVDKQSAALLKGV